MSQSMAVCSSTIQTNDCVEINSRNKRKSDYLRPTGWNFTCLKNKLIFKGRREKKRFVEEELSS